MARGAQVIAALACLCGISAAPAQDTPAAQYELKETAPAIGSNIKRKQVRSSAVALNLPYHQLPEDDKRALHSWWDVIPAGDEPPFPVDGLRALYEPLRQAQAKLGQSGALKAVAVVGANGAVVQAQVVEAPSEQMAQFAAQLLMVTKFKPAVCAGQPCRMEFPLNTNFVLRR